MYLLEMKVKDSVCETTTDDILNATLMSLIL